jgi:sugar phosphate isomerase/epimerase
MRENPIDMIRHFHQHIGIVHVAGVMVNGDTTHHPKNRGELTLPGQIIDYPGVMGTLRRYVPKGTRVLLEYIPNSTDFAGALKDAEESIALCES